MDITAILRRRAELLLEDRRHDTVVIGERPGPGGSRSPRLALLPTSGSTGARLAELMGVRDPYEAWDVRNVFAIPGDYWMPSEARNVMARWDVRYERVVLLGAKVARAFGLPPIPWLDRAPFVKGPGWPKVRAVVEEPGAEFGRCWAIPHPSGRNRWYNDPRNVAAARELLRSLIRETAHAKELEGRRDREAGGEAPR